jgi:hypothetical protein
MDVGKIINMDVAVATWGGKKKSRIIVGTIKDPPPTPRIPDKNPTINAIRTPITGLKPYSKTFPELSVKLLKIPLSLR